MKKVFDFGKIDFYGTGRKINAVTVEIEYKTKENGQKVFTASGKVWNNIHSDIICGGQCLDTIAEYIKAPVFRSILKLWKKYHLNDMRAECIHQAADGWRKAAREEITIHKYSLTTETFTAQRSAEKRILKAAKNGETVTATADEIILLNLSLSLESGEKLPDNIEKYYKLDKTVSDRRGWVDFQKDPRGLLGKACPVCGHKYGHGWEYLPIPEEDEKIILELLGGSAECA